MRIVRRMTVALLGGTLAAGAADTGTDPAYTYARSEDVGWASAQSADHDASSTTTWAALTRGMLRLARGAGGTHD